MVYEDLERLLRGCGYGYHSQLLALLKDAQKNVRAAEDTLSDYLGAFPSFRKALAHLLVGELVVQQTPTREDEADG